MKRIMRLLEKKNQKKTMLILFFAHFPFGLLMALLTPNNILDHAWAQAYTDFVAGLLPFVSAVGIYTKVPATQFMAAVFSLVTSFYSILFAYVCLRFNVQGSEKYFFERRLIDKVGIVMAPFFFGFAVWVICFDGLNIGFLDSRFRFMIGSKLGMGTYGIGLISAMWFLVSGVFCSIFFFFRLIKRSLVGKQTL